MNKIKRKDVTIIWEKHRNLVAVPYKRALTDVKVKNTCKKVAKNIRRIKERTLLLVIFGHNVRFCRNF